MQPVMPIVCVCVCVCAFLLFAACSNSLLHAKAGHSGEFLSCVCSFAAQRLLVGRHRDCVERWLCSTSSPSLAAVVWTWTSIEPRTDLADRAKLEQRRVEKFSNRESTGTGTPRAWAHNTHTHAPHHTHTTHITDTAHSKHATHTHHNTLITRSTRSFQSSTSSDIGIVRPASNNLKATKT